MKAGYVVPLLICNGNVEVHENNVYAKMRGSVLSRGGGDTALRKEHARKYSKTGKCCFLHNESVVSCIFLLPGNGVVRHLESDLTLSKFGSGCLHGSQQGGPIVNIAGKDVRDHVARERGNQDVER